MKQCVTLLSVLVLLVTNAFAQLTGTKNVPGDYASLGAAIADLNTKGVGAGGVTISVIAGHPVMAPVGGYAITTRSATEINPIVVEGNGNWIVGQDQKALSVPFKAILKIANGMNVIVSGFVMRADGSSVMPMIIEMDAPIKAQSAIK